MTFSDKTMEMTDDEYNYSQESNGAARSEPGGAVASAEPEGESVAISQAIAPGRSRRRTGKSRDSVSGKGVDSGSASDVPGSTDGGTTPRGKTLAKRASATELFDPKRMSAVGWTIDKRTSFESWQAQGEMLQAIESATPFWIGDWCEFGEGKWGEKYAQGVKDTGYAQQTLQNYAFVARHIPIEHRRSELRFTHHAEVASLDMDVIDEMLTWAVENRASAKGLRAHVNEYKASVRGTPEPQESVIAAPQGDPDGEAVPEATGERVGTPEIPAYTYCEQHGHVLTPHTCAASETVVIDATVMTSSGSVDTLTKTAVDVAALYEKQGKLIKSQAIKFVEQHERELVEDMGGTEPEWLGMYINWVLEAVQGIGPKHTAADAFAAGYAAGRGN